MKRTLTPKFLLALIILVSLAACHGSSSGPAQPTKAVITLAMTGTLPTGTLIYGARATVNLPTGVTVKASPSSANPNAMETDSAVVTASGQAAGAEIVFASYIASSATTTVGKVEINIAKSTGFSTGDFATVNCVIAAGHSPSAADFTITDFKAIDQNGVTISHLTVGFTADIH
jgi:hypothetical protein